MNFKNSIPGIGFKDSFLIFGGASLLLILETKFLIPYLSRVTGWETVIFWFIVAGLGIFLPLLLIAYLLLNAEDKIKGRNIWKDRLRFGKLQLKDILIIVVSILVIGALSALIMTIIEKIAGPSGNQPAFMEFKPLTADRYWILLIWLPYWILNIMGEEILWRGVLLPRQEVYFGKKTWMVNGFLWGVFHIAFGWKLMLTLLPILFVLPFAVQKTKNSWAGVIIHAAVNGPSFIAISFGLL